MRALRLSISLGASFAAVLLWACSSSNPTQASSASTGSTGDATATSSVGPGGSAATNSSVVSAGTGGGAGGSEGAGGAGGAGGAFGGPSMVAQIALGDRHSCARMTTGELYCWGEDDIKGTLGSGSDLVTSPTPIHVKDSTGVGYLAGVKYVAAGYDHTCAILSGGTLVCFGGNTAGQLGNGGGMSSNVPVAVKGVNGAGVLSGVKKVACGTRFTCALAGVGVYCWGQGPLGDGGMSGSPVPVQVLNADGTGPFTNAVEIGAGEEHVCLRKADKTLHCFGYNSKGQLGTGSVAQEFLPAQVKNVAGQPGFLSGVEEIASLGFYHSCVRVGGAVACWGADEIGELGASAPDLCPGACAKLPRLVSGIGAPNPAVEIAVGEDHACARLTDGSVVCWGANSTSELGGAVNTPCPPANPGDCSFQPVTVTTSADLPFTAAHIASGSGGHTCAIAPDHTVWCWGNNLFGELGDGTMTTAAHPVPVIGL